MAAAEHEFLARNPYRLVHEHDMRGGRYVVRVQVVQTLPEEIAVLISDIVRALNDSLNEITTHLAGTFTRFPIYESLPLFAQRSRKAIASMSDEAQADLEALQPYHAIGGFRNGPLWILQQLAVPDAIRLADGGIREDGTMGVNTERKVSLGELSIVAGPFADGAVVASVPVKIVGPDPKLDMFLRVEFALAFRAGNPGRGREVVALLRELCEHVDHTVFGTLERTM